MSSKLLLSSVKCLVKKMERQAIDWEKILANYISNKEEPRIYKEFPKPNRKSEIKQSDWNMGKRHE